MNSLRGRRLERAGRKCASPQPPTVGPERTSACRSSVGAEPPALGPAHGPRADNRTARVGEGEVHGVAAAQHRRPVQACSPGGVDEGEVMGGCWGAADELCGHEERGVDPGERGVERLWVLRVASHDLRSRRSAEMCWPAGHGGPARRRRRAGRAGRCRRARGAGHEDHDVACRAGEQFHVVVVGLGEVEGDVTAQVHGRDGPTVRPRMSVHITVPPGNFYNK